MSVKFKVFEWNTNGRGDPISWEAVFEEAAAFASELEPARLIGISHSHSHGQAGLVGGTYQVGLVTVWYWDGD